MLSLTERYVDPTVYAIPLYVFGMVGEVLALRGRARVGGRAVVGYELADTFASLGMGVGSLLFAGAIQLGVFLLAERLWAHRLVDLGTGALGWTVALLGWEFSFYWHHRWSHEVRILWASHVNHHSSLHYNLSTALRQEWTPFTNLVLLPPWALLGVRPTMLVFAGGLNLIYQFFLHTEVVGKLPWPLEYVLNTPSHHRVHHASNGRYLDKNYGGVLIVFDRLFGTFAEEEEPCVYGLTTNITSKNPLVIASHEYVAIFRQVLRARSLGGALRVLTRMPPDP
ncbi:MAG TPA: sterol desaturase family protein [Polyangiaceae bacterium]|nr:sterol desaturase family protein [Polyangiaceae bacterium]